MTTGPEFVLASGGYVGGQIVMDVKFVSLDPVKRLRLELPEIEGAHTETLVRPATRRVTIEGDEGYSILGEKGYIHETRLAIIPRRSGTIVIPPIRVSGVSAPLGALSFPFKELYPQQLITVHPPSTGFDGDVWVVSREVTIEDAWTPEITAIRAGDTVRRRVTLSVAGVTAEDLPDLTLSSNDGYRVLSTEVSAKTELSDTGFNAHVEQSWDIYVETDEVIHVGAVRFPYWNPELAKTEIASVPRRRVEPLPRDEFELRDQMRDRLLAEHRAKRLGLAVLLSLPAAVLIGFLALALWRALPTRADVRLWRAARQTDASLEFYGSYLSWGRHTFGPRTALGRQEHLSTLGARASDHVARLHRSIFGPRGGDVETKRIAATLIWASRRKTVTRFLSAVIPGLSRFLFLR